MTITCGCPAVWLHPLVKGSNGRSVRKCPFAHLHRPQSRRTNTIVRQKSQQKLNTAKYNQPWGSFDPIPLEIRYKIFNTLVESFEDKKVYITIDGTTPCDAILNLSRTSHKLRDEITEWFKAKSNLRLHPKFGVFNPDLTTFYIDLCFGLEAPDGKTPVNSIECKAFLERCNEVKKTIAACYKLARDQTVKGGLRHFRAAADGCNIGFALTPSLFPNVDTVFYEFHHPDGRPFTRQDIDTAYGKWRERITEKYGWNETKSENKDKAKDKEKKGRNEFTLTNQLKRLVKVEFWDGKEVNTDAKTGTEKVH